MSGISSEFRFVSLEELANRRALREKLPLEERVKLNWSLTEAAEECSSVDPILRNGANPDTKDQRKLTALIISTAYRQTANIKVLLESRANPLIEAPAVMRGFETVVTDNEYSRLPGDVPITAPLISVVTGVMENISLFRGVDIPAEWHDAFMRFAVARDTVNEAQHRPQRITPLVNQILKLGR